MTAGLIRNTPFLLRRCCRLAPTALACVFLLVALSLRAQPAATLPAAQQSTALSVERIYSYPSLGGQPLRGTSWSPDGKWLTYLEEEYPGPELVAIDADTGRRRVLVDAAHLRDILLPPASRGQQTGLGRLAPTQYLWAPNGEALLFISAKKLFWYELKSGKAIRLVTSPDQAPDGTGNIADVKISPDSLWVSFVRDHDLWLASVTTGQARQLTSGGSGQVRHAELDWVYPEELDLYTAYWWSPDSTRIAFLELDERHVERYPLVNFLSYSGSVTEELYPVAGSPNPVARIGVVPVSGGPVRWMDTGVDPTVLLARVRWLRDSRHLAIERLNREQNRLDLLFADAATGASRIALAEHDKYWINLSDDLYFFADGKRFLWSSERSGFRHLYLYDLAGRQLAQLTHGDWQVDEVNGIDEKSGWVYFTSSEKSPIEQHLYRVSLSGGEPVLLTHDHGTHEIRMAPNCLHFLDSHSTAMTPPRQDLYAADGAHLAVVDANAVPDLARYDLQPVEFLTVSGADGTPLDAEIIKPPHFDPMRKYPVLVHLYGGPQGQEVVDAWQGSTFLWNELMAQKGFVIFVVDNRGTAGRGHNFETPVYHHLGKVELADLLASISWLKRQPYVDGTRLGIWGWSYGGYMTCMAMLRGGDVFRAGLAVAPVTDWRQYDTIYTERYMGTPQENPQGYSDSSPVNFASGLRGKLLIVHATGDDNVHFANTVELAERLVEAQKYAEYQIYAGEGHGIGNPTARIHIFNRAMQFFLRNVAGRGVTSN
jgi:dipeptidyl-peptidase 4